VALTDILFFVPGPKLYGNKTGPHLLSGTVLYLI